MDRVLSTAELLDKIFSFNNRVTNARCARVCKRWFEPVLKELWHSVDTLQNIFAILAPILELGERGIHSRFSRMLTVRDWDRFYEYSSNVRCLTVDRRTWLMTSVFRDVMLNRTRDHLFPRLNKLKISVEHSSIENINLYLHNDVSEINIEVEGSIQEYEPLLNEAFAVITDRTNKITRFILKGNVQIRSVEYRFIQFIRGQNLLKSIVIPLYNATPSIFSSLSALRELEEIGLYYVTEDAEDSNRFRAYGGRGARADALGFNPILPRGAFPKLLNLELAVGIQDLIDLFSMENAPTKITRLYVHFLDVGDGDSIRRCLELLVNRCKLLVDINLEMIFEATVELVGFLDNVSFDDIRPLLELKALKRFAIGHPRPLLVTGEDLDLLARSWVDLGYLSLNPEPLTLDEPLIDLSVLATFAKNCPKLATLELYLNALSADLQVLPVIPTIQENLKSLYFGFSAILDTTSVAVYLSSLCSPSCELGTFTKWPDELTNAVDEVSKLRRNALREFWIEVQYLLSVATSAIRVDRARAVHLANNLPI